jgi:signal transduction histidine kinase
MRAHTEPCPEPACPARDDPLTHVPGRYGSLVACAAAPCVHQHTLLGVRRDLHDKVGSSLSSVIMMLEVAERLVEIDTMRAQCVLADLRVDLAELITQVRWLVTGREDMHISRDVSTVLRAMLGRMSRLFADRLTISTDLDPLVESVPESVAHTAFWIVREAMANVLKHSGAQHCSVRLSVREGQLQVRIEDDGVGIPLFAPVTGSGLANMAWRATQQGGWCTVNQVHPSGTAVSAWLPTAGRGRESTQGRQAL